MSKILKGNEARAAMVKGISAVADSVRGTLGPDAYTVLYKAPSGRPFVVNDGVSVVRQIKPEDPFEELGASLMREVAEEAQKASGDGTTTATIMAEAMCLHAFQLLNEGNSAKSLKRELDDDLLSLLHHIGEVAVDVNENDLLSVATISANNDEELGKVISDAFNVVGDTGTIVMMDGLTDSPQLDFIQGMKISSGPASQHLMKNQQEVEYTDAIVVVTDEVINDFPELVPALTHSVEEKLPLVLICGNISKIALDTLALNVVQGKVDATVLILPGQGKQKEDIAGDIACRAGAKHIMSGLGERLKDFQENWGGEADVIVRDNSSVLIPHPDGQTDEDVNEREAIMREAMEESEHDWDKRVLADRIANLQGRVATISISANTEAEGMETKMRIDDSINATRAALQSGVVRGGGVIHHSMLPLCRSGIMMKGLMAVAETLANNAGLSVADWIDSVGSIIIDPASVVANSLRAATSVSSLVLTTDTLIIET